MRRKRLDLHTTEYRSGRDPLTTAFAVLFLVIMAVSGGILLWLGGWI